MSQTEPVTDLDVLQLLESGPKSLKDLVVLAKLTPTALRSKLSRLEGRQKVRKYRSAHSGRGRPFHLYEIMQPPVAPPLE
jgi:predicted ArsR family transcriptional regulator